MTMNYSATVTLTVAGLAGLTMSNAFTTTMVDNSTTLYDDILVWLKLRCTGSATTNGVVNIYAVCRGTGMDVASVSYSSSIAAPVLNVPLADVMKMGTTATGSATSVIGPISMATAFGGMMPPQFAICVENLSGATFASGGTENVVAYQGVKIT